MTEMINVRRPRSRHAPIVLFPTNRSAPTHPAGTDPRKAALLARMEPSSNSGKGRGR